MSMSQTLAQCKYICNSTVRIHNHRILLNDYAMPTIEETRRQNLEQLIAEAGTIRKLAERSGLSESYLGQIRNELKSHHGKVRNLGTTAARKIESGMGLVRGWMDRENNTTGTESNVAKEQHPSEYLGNTAPAPLMYRYRLISSVQAGEWSDILDHFEPGTADEWISTTRKAGAHAFWLRIKGESMLPRFPPDGLILVDPDAGANPGDYVVAKLTDTQEATFKKLATDAGAWFLVPLNDRFPVIPIDRAQVRIVGRMVYHQPAGESF